MKSGNKNFIKKIFSKIKIKHTVLLAYILLPALIVAVGFAAWTITGHSTSGANGSFVASSIINSYSYIQVESDSSTGAKFNLFETGFYDGNSGKLETAPSIGVTYKIKFSNCFNDLLNSNAGNLYGEFTLMFPEGATGTPDIFNGMTCKINNNNAVKDAAFTLSAAPGDVPTTVLKTTTTEKSLSVLVKFTFAQGKTYNNNTQVEITYTLAPSSIDYKALYNYLAGNTSNQLMIDVKITSDIPSEE